MCHITCAQYKALHMHGIATLILKDMSYIMYTYHFMFNKKFYLTPPPPDKIGQNSKIHFLGVNRYTRLIHLFYI